MKPGEMEVIVPLARSPGIDAVVQQQIERLQRHCFVELEAVKQFHAWLDDKRYCRQAGRVIGDSRTGKTFAICRIVRAVEIPHYAGNTSRAKGEGLSASQSLSSGDNYCG